MNWEIWIDTCTLICIKLITNKNLLDFPGGAVVKNPPAHFWEPSQLRPQVSGFWDIRQDRPGLLSPRQGLSPIPKLWVHPGRPFLQSPKPHPDPDSMPGVSSFQSITPRSCSQLNLQFQKNCQVASQKLLRREKFQYTVQEESSHKQKAFPRYILYPLQQGMEIFTQWHDFPDTRASQEAARDAQ